jgi:hypothetical protein
MLDGPNATLENSQSAKKAGKGSQRLSPARKAAAKRSAKKAGRRYPNFVDNIRAASKKKTVHKKKTRKR